MKKALAVCLALALAGCSNSSPLSGTSGLPGGGSGSGRTFLIKPGPNATSDMVAAMVQAAPGDVIQFDCGFFDLGQTFQLINTEDVRVKGCGKDKTVLSFRNADAAQGILAVNVHGITVEDLTVVDSGANAFEFRGVDHGTLRRVRALWSSGGGRSSSDPITAANYAENNARRLNTPCTDPPTRNPNSPENVLLGDTTSPDYAMDPGTGRYGIYPVLSKNILIEESEAVGASDAGIYVGQSNTAIIRNNRAVYNPFGFEIENVQDGEYAGNLAECNTGGFLVYDLDGLTQYGDRTRMYDNIVRMNNSYNVAEHPGLVKEVPPGTGMITLGYDRIDVFDNQFTDNNTVGILHISYALFPPGSQPTDKRMDGFSEGVHIFRNKFVNSGNALPIPSTTDIQNQDVLRVFPALIGVKNMAGCLVPTNTLGCASVGAIGLRGAHIMWDGLLDKYDAECPYPSDADGQPVPKDERGKPIQGNRYPNPACTYNAYKFDIAATAAPLIRPEWFASCIDPDNEFSGDSLKYANFHGTKGLEAVVGSNIDPSDPTSVLSVLTALDPVALTEFGSEFDMSSHECVASYGRNLPLLPPVVIPAFERSGDFDPGPTVEEVARLCSAAVPAGGVNFGAARVDCPTLDQYHLFANPEDPTSAPNGGGVPFVLNTKLFSDYAVKYRVAYIPPGTHAIYNDKAGNGVDATVVFPVGTIIAKTFAFTDDNAHTEIPVETRLLIKRVTSKGREHWDGAAYLWSTDVTTGKRVARLTLGGATASAAWDYTDVDSGAHHAGSTQGYLIPNRNDCLTCHSAENKDPGASPIGPKVRFMNRPYASESRFVTEQGRHEVLARNQIQYWCEKGLLTGCPGDLGVNPVTQIATNLERIPAFNKPGDSGFAANSPQDIESRARAWLEVNCQHCHNPNGFAANTGFYLDSFRVVDGSYGICKQPTAAGAEGSGGRTYDIQPSAALQSILEFRISPAATSPAARMPPLARSVVDVEGHALIRQWIDQVVTADESKYPGSTSCAGQ